MRSDATPRGHSRKPAKVQAIDSATPIRNARRFTPEIRSRIASDCKVYGCVETAKRWQIAFSAAVECRIEDLEKTIRRAEAWIRMQQQKEAA